MYNKPVTLKDVTNGLFGPKPGKNNQTIRSSGDLPSMGQNLIPKANNDIVIPSTSVLDVLHNHKPERLNELDDEVIIGNGVKKDDIFNAYDVLKKYIDYTKIRKDELRQLLKPHKKRLNIRLTNITKPEMIKYIKLII